MNTELKHCPFCGDMPDINDPDVLHAVGGDLNMWYDEENNKIIYTLWQLSCNRNGCGCGAAVLGDSREDCIRIWNTRV